jgi:hypothetical protein
VGRQIFESFLISIWYSQGCGKPGHWMRDGLCKPEDVAAKVARDYAAFQASSRQRVVKSRRSAPQE